MSFGAGHAAASLLLAAAFGVAGYALRGGPTPTAAAPAARVVPLPVGGACDGASLDEIRAVVRDEVAQRVGAPAAAIEAPGDAPASAEPAAPTRASLEAQAAIDAAVATGEWRDPDRAVLARLLPDLTAPERDHLLSGLARSINEGALRPSPGPLVY